MNAPGILPLFTSLVCLVTSQLATSGEFTKPVEEVRALALQQSRIADKFSRLEKLFLRMAEFDAAANPRRAVILKKAVVVSKDAHIQLQFETLVKLLGDDRLGRALDNQTQLRDDLEILLDLLMTENHSDRLKDEKTRIKNQIREIEKLLRMQRFVQSKTERSSAPRQLGEEQSQIAKRTDALSQQMAADEQELRGPQARGSGTLDKPNVDSSSEKGGGKSPQPESEDDETDEQTEDGQGAESQSNDGGQSSDGPAQEPRQRQEPGQGGDPRSQADSPSKPPEEGRQQGNQPPGRRRIQQAHRRMKQAENKLAKAETDKAVSEQEAARQELEAAKAELEEILRQMREEEIKRVLAMLETRFQKMLEMQLRVYEETQRLEESLAENPERRLEIEAGKLSYEERRIGVEADRCLVLLREEASSVAFPESVQMMRDDIEVVVQRLASSQLGDITQGVEEDILESLREMIESLQRAQEDQEQQQQVPTSGMANMEPGNRPLVDQIAELKMIKALQLRVNRRTDRHAKLLEGVDDLVGQAREMDLIDSLERLSERERRIQKITRDVVTGKNK